MKFYDKYYDFYMTIKDDLTVDSNYIGKSGKPKEATGKINLDKDLKDIIEELEGERVASKPPTKGKIKRGGELLFKALFVDEIGVHFSNAFDEIDKNGFGLRILLNIAPKHTGFPWEIAKYKGKFLATDIKTPFLRIFPGKTRGINLGEGKMPRVLSILSNVESKYAVDIGREQKNLEQIILRDNNRVNFGGFKDVIKDAKTGGALCKSGNPSLLDIEEFLNSVRVDHMEDPFNIIHFLAHGLFDEAKDLSAIVLQPTEKEKNEGKDEIHATGTDLAETFGNEFSIALIILNACSTGKILSNSSGLVPQLLQRSPAVVAMRKGIEKDTATEFTCYFYKCFTPQNAEVAIQTARKMLLKKFQNTIDFSIPVLYLGYDEKTRIPAKGIFEKTRASAQPWTPATNLNPAGVTILTLIELHDKSLSAQDKWDEWFRKDNNLSASKILPQDMLQKTLFGEFNQSLSKTSRLICDTFPNAAPTWNERRDRLDLDMKKLVDVAKQGNKLGIRPVINEWQQNYENLEKLICHIVTAGKEVK